jgi:Zn-dependent protease with chaperone function
MYLFAIVCYSQKPVLLDTLTTSQKVELKENYIQKKKTFYALTEQLVEKKRFKQVKDIFDKEYEDIEKSINNNELLAKSPLNQYLYSLTAQIQKQNIDATQNISILVSREYQTNAWNTGEGTIIVNNYLLNDLNNEDQLVFIICHEIAHQALNHVLNSVLKYVDDNNSSELKSQTKAIRKQTYNRATQAENLLKEIAYKNSAEKRKNETQADSLGFIFYSKLGRNLSQSIEALKRLKYSDVESDSLTVSDYKRIFSALNINLKDEWFALESYDMYHYKQSTKFNTDSLRTHPNCDDRIARLVKTFPQIDTNNKAGVLPADSKEFTQWRENAAYQNIYNEYLSEHYGNSLYEALKLYNRKPDDFLKKSIGLNFKKLYEAKKAYRLNRYVNQVNTNRYTDSYNLFCTFIFNLTIADLETLSHI